MKSKQFRNCRILTAIVVQCVFVNVAFSQTAIGAHWVPTWTAAAQSGKPAPIKRTDQPAQPAAAQPAPAPAPIVSLKNQTARMIVHTSIGGNRVRVELSNVFGEKPVQIGAAHIALRAKDSAIVPGLDRVLTFNGKPSFTLPPGAALLSDPVDLKVPQAGDLLVSVYVPGDTGIATLHSVGSHTTYIKEGDQTGVAEISGATKSLSYYLLSAVEVAAPAKSFAIVTFGDSITDGTRSTPDTNSPWPSFLAERLLGNPSTSHIAVSNEGISGNRIFRDGIGPSGLARFDRDVLGYPNVKWMTILLSTNDLGGGDGEMFVIGPKPEEDNPTVEDITGAYKQMIERARAHGIKVIGCTVLPFKGAAYYSEHGNRTRLGVNEWIRTSKAYDAVVDFDAVIRNPSDPNSFRPEFDAGDHLHPNDAGYKAMANAFDLVIFGGRTVTARN